jgi:hypothetical protein
MSQYELVIVPPEIEPTSPPALVLGLPVTFPLAKEVVIDPKFEPTKAPREAPFERPPVTAPVAKESLIDPS